MMNNNIYNLLRDTDIGNIADIPDIPEPRVGWTRESPDILEPKVLENMRILSEPLVPQYPEELSDSEFDFSKYDDEDSDTIEDTEISLEITDWKSNGKPSTYIYTVPRKGSSQNEKRLLCFSVLSGQDCIYRHKCTYAHNLDEQVLDIDKGFVYQIILDQSLMNFFSVTNPKTDEIYKSLLAMTQICDKCIEHQCTGGYNCKYGVFDNSVKLCKNDIMMGECINHIQPIVMNPLILNKFVDNVTVPVQYTGCLNGHHLTDRGFIPYYKFLNMKEATKKNYYKSTRYIDIDATLKILKNEANDSNCIKSKFINNETSSSDDEELNELFRKDKYNDDTS